MQEIKAIQPSVDAQKVETAGDVLMPWAHTLEWQFKL